MKKRSTKVRVKDKVGVAFFNVRFDELRFVYMNLDNIFALVRREFVEVIEGKLDELETEDWS